MAEMEIARKVVAAWEALPGGRHYSPKVVEAWMASHMAPMIAEMRAIIEAAPPAPHMEPVQDTYFVDSSLPVMAISGDVESDRVLKLHFRRPVSDEDRKALTDALNLHQRSLASPPAPQVKVTAEEHNASFDLANDALGGAFKDGFREGWLFAKDPGFDDREELEADYSRAVDIAPSKCWDAYRSHYFAMLPLAAIPDVGEAFRAPAPHFAPQFLPTEDGEFNGNEQPEPDFSALEEIKYLACTAGAPNYMPVHKALARILFLCNRAGVTKKLDELRPLFETTENHS